ncbi:MAG TPA: hypothetical protein ACQGQW_08630, partial [Xylella fastidiosa subsp. pauca]
KKLAHKEIGISSKRTFYRFNERYKKNELDISKALTPGSVSLSNLSEKGEMSLIKRRDCA